jgi:hypothetical protein
LPLKLLDDGLLHKCLAGVSEAIIRLGDNTVGPKLERDVVERHVLQRLRIDERTSVTDPRSKLRDQIDNTHTIDGGIGEVVSHVASEEGIHTVLYHHFTQHCDLVRRHHRSADSIRRNTSAFAHGEQSLDVEIIDASTTNLKHVLTLNDLDAQSTGSDRAIGKQVGHGGVTA